VLCGNQKDWRFYFDISSINQTESYFEVSMETTFIIVGDSKVWLYMSNNTYKQKPCK
jgi:hypothetical protein